MKERPPSPNTALEEIEHSELRTNSCSGPSTAEVDIKQLHVDEESTTDENRSFVDQSSIEMNTPITPPPLSIEELKVIN